MGLGLYKMMLERKAEAKDHLDYMGHVKDFGFFPKNIGISH